MSTHKLYFCPKCFRASMTDNQCPQHGSMMECIPGAPGHAQRRPVKNAYGDYWSTAPRWFLEALGWIKYGPTRE